LSVRRRLVRLPGGPASYRDEGSGPVAVLAAGLGLSGRFYDGSYAAFAAAGVRLVVPDLPGAGATPGAATGLTPAATARFLADFAAALAIPRAVWIGHSVGAQAVVELAAHQPELAAGLVLVGPTGAPGRGEVPRQALALGLEATRTSLHVIRGVARDYLRTSPLRYFGTWLRHGRHDLPARLPLVHCPVLIMVGDADPVCRPRFVELLCRRLPRARVEWVRGGTHALPRGHAAAFNRIATSFVIDVADRPVDPGTAGGAGGA
jgi:pimeloyl-ACP methyl ester carboxylesterase